MSVETTAEELAAGLEGIDAVDIDINPGLRGARLVEFRSPLPGDQPIRSSLRVDEEGVQGTLRLGELEDVPRADHPSKDIEMLERLKTAVRQAEPPDDVSVYAHFGDVSNVPRPHVLFGFPQAIEPEIEEQVSIGMSPTGAVLEDLLIQEGKRQAESGEAIGFVRRLFGSVRREFFSTASGAERYAEALRDAGFEDVKVKELGSMRAIDFQIRSDAEGFEARELHPSSLIIGSDGTPDTFVLRFPAVELAVHDRTDIRDGLDAAAAIAERERIPVHPFTEAGAETGNPHVDSLGQVPENPGTLAEFLREMRTAFFEGVDAMPAVPDFREDIKRRMREGIGIEDVPRLEGLLWNIEEAIADCLEPRDVPDFAKEDAGSKATLEMLDELVTVERILVFGSFARETALRGESDLDLLVTITIEDTANTAFVRTEIEDCLLEKAIIEDHESWFASVDVVVVEDDEAAEQVRSMFNNPFDEPRLPPDRVFDLRERAFGAL